MSDLALQILHPTVFVSTIDYVNPLPNPVDFMMLLTVFALAIFVGFEIITKVPPTLHTPLMSGSNAISGITIVGALLAAGMYDNFLSQVLGFIAIIAATVNVVGGFLVTHRMLSMFSRKKSRG